MSELSTVEKVIVNRSRTGMGRLLFGIYTQGETGGFMAGSTLALTVFAATKGQWLFVAFSVLLCIGIGWRARYQVTLLVNGVVNGLEAAALLSGEKEKQ